MFQQRHFEHVEMKIVVEMFGSKEFHCLLHLLESDSVTEGMQLSDAVVIVSILPSLVHDYFHYYCTMKGKKSRLLHLDILSILLGRMKEAVGMNVAMEQFAWVKKWITHIPQGRSYWSVWPKDCSRIIVVPFKCLIWEIFTIFWSVSIHPVNDHHHTNQSSGNIITWGKR